MCCRVEVGGEEGVLCPPLLGLGALGAMEELGSMLGQWELPLVGLAEAGHSAGSQSFAREAKPSTVEVDDSWSLLV